MRRLLKELDELRDVIAGEPLSALDRSPIIHCMHRSQVNTSPFGSNPLKAIYRVAQKFGTIFMYTLTLPDINRFSKLFHCQNQEKFVIILSLKIPPYLKCVATLPCEMSSVLKAAVEKRRRQKLSVPLS